MGRTNKKEQGYEHVSRKKLLPHLNSLERYVYPLAFRKRDFLVETGPIDSDRGHLLLPVLPHMRRKGKSTQALVITASVEAVRQTERLIRRVPHLSWLEKRVLHLDSEEASRKEAGQIGRQPHVLVATSDRIIDHLRRDNLSLDHVHAVVVDEPERESASGFNVDVQFILSKLNRHPHMAVFTPSLHEETDAIISLLRRPRVCEREDWLDAGSSESSKGKEQTVSNEQRKKNDFPSEEKIAGQIEEIIRQIHEEENPDELNYYRKLVRKHVPFFTRGYFAAYLLKNGSTPRKSKKNSTQFTSMFVGVGKNRRVFPRDLIQLFSSVNGVSAEDVGEIKILDNYSFAEITTEKAPDLIRELNGTEYRGRKLTVNFAKRKD